MHLDDLGCIDDRDTAAVYGGRGELAGKAGAQLRLHDVGASDELNRVLANLEGSTLVKRLKAASRTQLKVATRLGDFVGDAFGVAQTRVIGNAARNLAALSDQEVKGSHEVSLIMDDMSAYFERRRFAQFKAVLDEMRTADVIGGLRQLGDDVRKANPDVSIVFD